MVVAPPAPVTIEAALNLLQNGASSEMAFSSIVNRTDIPLSSHPLLRKHHPDYNASTKADHDPIELEGEAVRFSEDYLKEEMHFVKKQVCPELVERFTV